MYSLHMTTTASKVKVGDRITALWAGVECTGVVTEVAEATFSTYITGVPTLLINFTHPGFGDSISIPAAQEVTVHNR
jgi:hypothetical protein